MVDLSTPSPIQHHVVPPGDAIALFLSRYEVAGWISSAERSARRADAPRRKKKAAERLRRMTAKARREMDAAEFAAWQAEQEYEAERAQFFIERGKEKARFTHKRFTQGFEHDPITLIGGEEVPAFRERGLRSEGMGAAAKLFVAGTRRGWKIRGSNNKAVMSVHWTRRKVHALDLPWIEGNRKMVSLIRIDLDKVFKGGVFELVWELEQLVGRTIPCFPHMVAGGGLREKEWLNLPEDRRPLVRPHLWFILPPGSAVVATGNGKQRIVDLLGGVQRGLCHALLHLGADPNAPILSVRGKNPLSPYLLGYDLNNEVFPTLSEYSEFVRTSVSREELTRMAAEVQSTVGKTASNLAFTTWQKEAYSILHALRSIGDAEYLRCIETKDREGLAFMLRERMDPAVLVERTNWQPKDVEAILGHVISYAAGAWDHERGAGGRAKRGAMRHLITEGMTVEDRRRASGVWAGREKADKALTGLVEAIRQVEAAGENVTKTSVARVSGLHRITVGRRWDDAMAILSGDCNNRCVDIKAPHLSGSTGGRRKGPRSGQDSGSLHTRRKRKSEGFGKGKGFIRPSFLRDTIGDEKGIALLKRRPTVATVEATVNPVDRTDVGVELAPDATAHPAPAVREAATGASEGSVVPSLVPTNPPSQIQRWTHPRPVPSSAWHPQSS
ncbi:hypothetical protein [Microvirga tunisiensis]|uniref:Uncharacterized protein n=1 Tax=Microvirga tunisiensis TaxID=2108360 RepID=A0A5N7MH54_9HYPH|nr:hypothetical protein [Microvirga tunisiensis]MPR06197.1 hypothetical protein [Microvirga tunisiensis]MPR26060.1 hypothetical protein [Microvirga tunisiensis]